MGIQSSALTILTPFYREIMYVVEEGQGTKFGVVSRNNRPEEHLRVYKAHTYIHYVDDVAYYRYFHVILKEFAQKWFSRLSPNGITCF